jgi:hypothetical protein
MSHQGLTWRRSHRTIFLVNNDVVIAGYGGYIQSMKSENLFAKTYGKTTYEI